MILIKLLLIINNYYKLNKKYVYNVIYFNYFSKSYNENERKINRKLYKFTNENTKNIT